MEKPPPPGCRSCTGGGSICQSLTSNLSLAAQRRRPIQRLNAQGSELTRRQPPRLRVGEAPHSLHRPASMQPPGVPFSEAACKRARPLDHRNYPIDTARGPRGAPSPSNAPLTRRSGPFVRAPPPAPAARFQSAHPPDPRPRDLTSAALSCDHFYCTHSALVSCV